jgi:hypothetical protein
MTTTELLSPALLHAVAVFIVALSALMIAAHTGILALAAQRSSLAPRAQLMAPLIAAALLAGWLGWAVLAVSDPVTVPPPPEGRQPILVLKMAVLLVAGVAVLYASKTMRTLNAATPPEWLIGVQVYRTAGAMFLWPFLTSGSLPAAFALPAGIGDALTGLAAPFVAWSVARNRPGAHAWAVAWNLFGVLDLIVAPVAAVWTQAPNIARFPLVIVPLFLGPPLGILTHIYSLRNLAVNRPRLVRAPNAAFQS